MIEKLLKAEAWQLFLVCFGLPFIGAMFWVGGMIQLVIRQNNHQSIWSVWLFVCFGIGLVLSLVGMFTHLWWNYAIATGLQKKLPQELKLKIKRYKFCFFFPIIYLVLVVPGVILSIYIAAVKDIPPFWLFLIIPFHFFAIFCFWYQAYFSGRTVKTALEQQRLGVSDYFAEILMIAFFPIGVWFLQPKINALTALKKEDDATQQKLFF